MITITSDTDTTQKRGKTRQMQTHSPNNQIQIHERQCALTRHQGQSNLSVQMQHYMTKLQPNKPSS